MKQKTSFALIIAMFVFVGCKTHYAPSLMPVYSFSDSKQINANASVAGNGVELQGAVSISKSKYASFLYEGVFYSENTRYRLYGLGFGHYATFGKRGRFNIGSELQIGNIGARDLAFTNYPRDHVARLLVNGNIGTEFRLVEYYAGFRMGNYSYFYNNRNDIQFRFEPTVTIKLGPGRFKFSTQLGLSIPTSGWNDLIPMGHVGFSFDTFKIPRKGKGL